MKAVTKVKLDTYHCNVVFIITNDLNHHVNGIYKKLKSKESFNGEAEGILLTLDIDNYYVLFDVCYLSHNTIAHEIYHCVVKVTEDRDIVDEEAQAWLAGYLTEKMYDFVQKKKFSIIKSK
jgi:hypothetical protein